MERSDGVKINLHSLKWKLRSFKSQRMSKSLYFTDLINIFITFLKICVKGVKYTGWIMLIFVCLPAFNIYIQDVKNENYQTSKIIQIYCLNAFIYSSSIKENDIDIFSNAFCATKYLSTTWSYDYIYVKKIYNGMIFDIF